MYEWCASIKIYLILLSKLITKVSKYWAKYLPYCGQSWRWGCQRGQEVWWTRREGCRRRPGLQWKCSSSSSCPENLYVVYLRLFFSFFSKIHLSGDCHVAIILVQMVSDASTFISSAAVYLPSFDCPMHFTMLTPKPSGHLIMIKIERGGNREVQNAILSIAHLACQGKLPGRHHFCNNPVPRYFIMCHIQSSTSSLMLQFHSIPCLWGKPPARQHLQGVQLWELPRKGRWSSIEPPDQSC